MDPSSRNISPLDTPCCGFGKLIPEVGDLEGYAAIRPQAVECFTDTAYFSGEEYLAVRGTTAQASGHRPVSQMDSLIPPGHA